MVILKNWRCTQLAINHWQTLFVTSEGLPLETLDLKDFTDSESLPPPPILLPSSSELWLDNLCLPPARFILPAAAAHATRMKHAIVSAKSSRPIVWDERGQNYYFTITRHYRLFIHFTSIYQLTKKGKALCTK